MPTPMLVEQVSGSFDVQWEDPTAPNTFLSLGQTQEGWELEVETFGEEIQSDWLGQSIVDVIQQGQNVIFSAILLQFNKAIVKSLLNAGTYRLGGTPPNTINHTEGEVGGIGCALSGQDNSGRQMFARQLRAVPISADLEYCGDKNTYTFQYAGLDPGSTRQWAYAAKLRRVPIRMRILPWQEGTAIGNRAKYYIIT